MPCNDVTVVMTVILDQDDRLKDYVFAKRSCGQGIGAESLLLDQLRGRELDELLNKSAEDYLVEFPAIDDLEEFLGLKHLFAIQGALEVLTGREPGGKDAAFAAATIDFGEDETRIEGRIAVDILTEKIQACGNCGTCGSEEVEEGRAQNAERRAARAEATTSA